MLLALSVTGNLAVAQQSDNSKSIDRIIAAMNKKDATALLGMMADSATIGNLSKMHNKATVRRIFTLEIVFLKEKYRSNLGFGIFCEKDFYFVRRSIVKD